jgi:hypothetical protein
LLLERVMAFSRQDDKPVLVADVLQVGDAATLASTPFAFADRDIVFVDQLAVDRFRVLVRLDPT